MKTSTNVMIACALFGAAATSIYAAEEHHHAMAAAQGMSYAATGEVVAVDQAAGKVKLKHSAIPELSWPAMTMFFSVADRARLDALKVGDRVEFKFVKVDGDSPRITRIKISD